MQFLQIDDNYKLKDLSERVGARNVEHILAANDIQRSPYIGKSFSEKCKEVVDSTGEVTWQRKSVILNTFTQDSDIFEAAALLGASSWKVLSELGTFPSMLQIPESIQLPDSVDILGNGQSVAKHIYQKVMQDLSIAPHQIDPGNFNEYSAMKHSSILESQTSGSDPIQWFKLPWGDISLYSSLAQTSIDFPVYPEDYQDSVIANYTQMPDMIMQYEPWFLYQSSGPRTNTVKFHMHRDMWSGDHNDGKANELIRFCEANCFPDYNGSAVNTATVTLYVQGQSLISGIMTEVSVEWQGPILSDGWYAEFTLSLSISEVAQTPLNFKTVKSKSLIG